MRKNYFISFLSLFVGIILLIYSSLMGELKIGILVIFPYLIGSGIYAFSGVLLIIIAFFSYFFGNIIMYNKNENKKIIELKDKKKESHIKAGGVILIGPIPIIFGSNWKLAIITILTAVVFIFVIFLSFRNYI